MNNPEKAIINAIAKAIINDKKDVIALINRHYKFRKNADVSETSSFILRKLATDKRFAEDFTNLLVRKKYLTVTDEDQYHGFAVSAIVAAVGGVASKIIGNQTAKREQDAAKDNVTAEMLNALAKEREAKAKREQAQTIIIALIVLSVATISGIIIYKKMQ